MSAPFDFDAAADDLLAQRAVNGSAEDLDFDAAADALLEQQARPTPAARIQAPPPAQQGRSRELAKELGVPEDFAERNLPALEHESRLRAVPWSEVRASPALIRALRDPEQVGLVLGDIESLTQFREAISQTELRQALAKRRAATGIAPAVPISEVIRNRFELGRRMAFEINEAVFPLLMHDLGVREAPTQAERARFEEFMGRPIGPIDARGIVDDIFGATAEQLPILARTIGAGGLGSAVGAVAGAGLGSLAGGAGAAPGAALGARIGGGAGAALSIGKLEAAAAYTEFLDLRDPAGEPLPPEVIAAGALTVGAINSGIELGGNLLLPGASKLFGLGRRSVQASVQRQMLNPALRQSLLTGARKIAAAMLGEAATEAVQETVNVETGRVISGEGAGIPTAEEGARIGEAALQALLATGPIATATHLVDSRLSRIGKARAEVGRIETARQAVADAGIRGASPSTFEALTSDLAREAGVERIRIPAEELVARYEEIGAPREQMLQDAPEIAEQLEDALLTGGDVEVRVGTYFGKLEPRLGDALTQDLRLDPNGLTAREADVAEATLEGEAGAVLAEELVAEEGVRPEVRAAAREAGLAQPLFTDAASAGMSEDEFAAYQATAAGARARAEVKIQQEEERLQRAEARRIANENSRFNRARQNAIREATKEVAREPLYEAIDFLAQRVPRETEVIPGEGDAQRLVRRDAPERRLDIGVIESEYGREWLDRLPRNLVQRGGLHPDSVAELFGFDSGWELVQAIVTAPDREAAIEDRVRARLVDEFGSAELEPPPAMGPMIEEGVRVLLAEERALARRSGRGGQVTAWEAAKLAAERMISQERVGSLSPERHAQTAQKLAREAVEWLAQGNFSNAQDRKSQQILQLAQEREARFAQKTLERARKDLERWAKRPAQERLGRAGGGHQDQVNQILERFGFRSQTPPDPTVQRVSLERWANERQAEGDEVIAPDWLRAGGAPVAWRDLSVAQAKEVRDTVANLAHLSREELQIRTRSEREQLATIGERIAEKVREQFPKGKTPKGFTKTKWEQARSRGRAFDASLTFKEFIIDALSGDDPGSFLRRFVWEPLSDAQSAYNARLAEYTEKLNALMKAADMNRRGDQVLPESRLATVHGGRRLTRWNLIMIAMNLGNASNQTKLIEGYGWDERVVRAVLDQHMTEADWAFVQGVWDLVDTFWPEIAALERRVTGVAPPKIQAQQMETRFGTLRGGYFPVAYDPAQSQLGQRIEAANTSRDAVRFTRATTGHGHTEARTGAKAPLLLSPDVITAHMDQVLLDLTHREAIRDASRVLSRAEVDGEIQRALGEEFGFKRYWDPWMHVIARDTVDVGSLKSFEDAVRGARHRATIFKLGFRASTLLLQPIGLLNGFRILQQNLPGNTLSRFLRGFFLAFGNGNPREAGRTRAEVFERSAFMRDRIQNLDRDIRDAVRAEQRINGLARKPAQFAMELIGRVQRDVVDVPIWLAAYHAALGDMDMNEARAIRFADSMVRKSQGSGGKLSESSFQQGKGREVYKALTMFYSYNNLVYNQLFHTRRSGDVPGLLANYAMFALFPGIASAVMYALVKGEIPDPDDDDFAETVRGEVLDAVVMEVASTMPFVRDLNSFRYVGRPKSSSVFEMIYQEIGDAANPKDGMDVMFDALRLGALAAGLPGDYVLRNAEDALRDD